MPHNKTHFGFQTVDMKEKTSRVRDVFDRVSGRYDIMNDAMSFGLHHVWKRQFVDRMAPQLGESFLDVAGGTGDIAMGIVRALRRQTRRSTEITHAVTICDINASMMTVGVRKCMDLGFSSEIRWACGDGSALPFPDNHFDVYSISFGLRNITDPAAALSEAYRVLKPGGRFYCLEFSKIHNPLLRTLYTQYAFHVIPAMGSVLAGDRSSYRYLSESIEMFMTQQELAFALENAGFNRVAVENLNGGIVAIHQGVK